MRLGLWLDNRCWWRRTEPFPHVVAANVFRPATYEAIERSFREILDRGQSDTPNDSARFFRSMKEYDAFAYRFPVDIEGPLAIFVSREWHDMMAALFGVEATGEVEAALHHHAAGNTTGWIHNDLNPAWYVERRRADGIIISDAAACSYHHGTPHQPGVVPYERVRAIALLFYLANPPWKGGDGGETEIYKTRGTRPDAPDAVVPPNNNTLLAFECTPYSYHTFLSNRCSPRSSRLRALLRQALGAFFSRTPADTLVGLARACFGLDSLPALTRSKRAKVRAPEVRSQDPERYVGGPRRCRRLWPRP